MSGIRMDLLVDIDGSFDPFSPQSPNDLQISDDDPFELCSMQSRAPKQDLGLELGLALEKSIRLRSQSNQADSNNTAGTPLNSERADLGILVNLEDSPDKKIINSSNTNLASSTKESDSVFTHTSSNPFELAWDVIEQEALTLANHIQHDKEKQSPRKMVDLAMKLSPDSLLLSPRNNNRDEECLIHSSPEQEMKKTTTKSVVRGRLSMGSSCSSPALSKSYATPLRSRPSLAPNHPSPMRKISKLVAPSPAKPFLHRSTFKPPLFRSSSATTPLNQIHVPSKATVTRAAPLKVTHQAQPHPPANVRAPSKSTSDTPVRRSLGGPSFSVGAVPPSTGSFQSKLKTPLNRAEAETQHSNGSKAQEFNRNSSLRFGSKRASTSNAPPSAASSSSQSSRFTVGGRIKAKGRENIEP